MNKKLHIYIKYNHIDMYIVCIYMYRCKSSVDIEINI